MEKRRSLEVHTERAWHFMGCIWMKTKHWCILNTPLLYPISLTPSYSLALSTPPST